VSALIAIAERLAAVLCGADGRCVIAGSDGDREVVNDALEDLRRLPGNVRLRPLSWDDHGDPTAPGFESTCDKGFHLEHAPGEDDAGPWRLVWGEGEPDYFATLEEAKAEADREWSDFVTDQMEPAFDFVAHLRRQREWSAKTFGPGERGAGVVDHIRKELVEIEADPRDLREWIDVVILALDGAWRAGHSPEAIVEALVAKQTRNEGRTWPDWRTAEPGKAIEHVRGDGEVRG
jgi:hypothetical protein